MTRQFLCVHYRARTISRTMISLTVARNEYVKIKIGLSEHTETPSNDPDTMSINN